MYFSRTRIARIGQPPPDSRSRFRVQLPWSKKNFASSQRSLIRFNLSLSPYHTAIRRHGPWHICSQGQAWQNAASVLALAALPGQVPVRGAGAPLPPHGQG